MLFNLAINTPLPHLEPSGVTNIYISSELVEWKDRRIDSSLFHYVCGMAGLPD